MMRPLLLLAGAFLASMAVGAWLGGPPVDVAPDLARDPTVGARDRSAGDDAAARRPSDPAPQTPDRAAQAPAAGSPSPSPASTPPPPQSRAVTLAFGGDVHGEPPIRGVLEAGGNPLADVADLFRAADVAVVNVETAVGEGGEPQPKQYTFQAPASLWTALADAGVDIASLANNHALDHGVEGLRETITGARVAGVDTIGAGEDADEAYAAVVREVAGVRVAFVGLSRVLPVVDWAATVDRPGIASAYDEDAAAAAVARAAEAADIVVAVVHWGRELDSCPDDAQRRLAARLVAAGADLVVGHHPHVLQPVEDVGGVPVAWSLGNLAFYALREETRATGVLTVTFVDGLPTELDLVAARIDDAGAPQRLSGDAAREVIDGVLARTCPT